VICEERLKDATDAAFYYGACLGPCNSWNLNGKPGRLLSFTISSHSFAVSELSVSYTVLHSSLMVLETACGVDLCGTLVA
jgi:hypothetical protein